MGFLDSLGFGKKKQNKKNTTHSASTTKSTTGAVSVEFEINAPQNRSDSPELDPDRAAAIEEELNGLGGRGNEELIEELPTARDYIESQLNTLFEGVITQLKGKYPTAWAVDAQWLNSLKNDLLEAIDRKIEQIAQSDQNIQDEALQSWWEQTVTHLIEKHCIQNTEHWKRYLINTKALNKIDLADLRDAIRDAKPINTSTVFTTRTQGLGGFSRLGQPEPLMGGPLTLASYKGATPQELFFRAIAEAMNAKYRELDVEPQIDSFTGDIKIQCTKDYAYTVKKSIDGSSTPANTAVAFYSPTPKNAADTSDNYVPFLRNMCDDALSHATDGQVFEISYGTPEEQQLLLEQLKLAIQEHKGPAIAVSIIYNSQETRFTAGIPLDRQKQANSAVAPRTQAAQTTSPAGQTTSFEPAASSSAPVVPPTMVSATQTAAVERAAPPSVQTFGSPTPTTSLETKSAPPPVRRVLPPKPPLRSPVVGYNPRAAQSAPAAQREQDQRLAAQEQQDIKRAMDESLALMRAQGAGQNPPQNFTESQQAKAAKAKKEEEAIRTWVSNNSGKDFNANDTTNGPMTAELLNKYIKLIKEARSDITFNGLKVNKLTSVMGTMSNCGANVMTHILFDHWDAVDKKIKLEIANDLKQFYTLNTTATDQESMNSGLINFAKFLYDNLSAKEQQIIFGPILRRHISSTLLKNQEHFEQFNSNPTELFGQINELTAQEKQCSPFKELISYRDIINKPGVSEKDRHRAIQNFYYLYYTDFGDIQHKIEATNFFFERYVHLMGFNLDIYSVYNREQDTFKTDKEKVAKLIFQKSNSPLSNPIDTVQILHRSRHWECTRNVSPQPEMQNRLESVIAPIAAAKQNPWANEGVMQAIRELMQTVISNPVKRASIGAGPSRPKA